MTRWLCVLAVLACRQERGRGRAPDDQGENDDQGDDGEGEGELSVTEGVRVWFFGQDAAVPALDAAVDAPVGGDGGAVDAATVVPVGLDAGPDSGRLDAAVPDAAVPDAGVPDSVGALEITPDAAEELPPDAYAGPPCGDGFCDAEEWPWEWCFTCEADCGACCGDGVCSQNEYFVEDCDTCTADCQCPVCGNGVCDSSWSWLDPESSCVCPEDCPGNCCGNGVCEGWRSGDTAEDLPWYEGCGALGNYCTDCAVGCGSTGAMTCREADDCLLAELPPDPGYDSGAPWQPGWLDNSWEYCLRFTSSTWTLQYLDAYYEICWLDVCAVECTSLDANRMDCEACLCGPCTTYQDTCSPCAP